MAMHNNFTLDKTPKAQKQFYTVLEAAIHWARSEGAKSASDPRINHYSRLILAALENGALGATDKSSQSVTSYSLSTTLSAGDLRHWLTKNFPNARHAI